MVQYVLRRLVVAVPVNDQLGCAARDPQIALGYTDHDRLSWRPRLGGSPSWRLGSACGLCITHLVLRRPW